MQNPLLNQIETDLAELTSRGTNHPEADALVGRIRVALQQADDAAGAPAAAPDPLSVQLDNIHAQLEGLHLLVEAAINGKH